DALHGDGQGDRHRQGGTSIIVVSPEGREEDTAKVMRPGAHGYIAKPFKAESLHDIIEQVVAKRSQAMAA
ncbi:MAG TPA: hypothetical protein VEI46_00785, partial [Thermodesulfovibrionales bacterium]|nr:hypothetical protein [Thermodesulfovibrionales bacterium]